MTTHTTTSPPPIDGLVDQLETSCLSSMSTGGYRAYFVIVTAEMASEWLSRNTNNRQLGEGLVELYVDDMRKDCWVFDGAPIRFGSDGSLLDGQHRLTGFAKIGIPQLVLVLVGLDPETQRVMDSGRKRSLADALTLAGYENANTMAAVSKLCLAWDEGRIKTSASKHGGPESTASGFEFATSDPRIRWAVSMAKRSTEIPANPAAIGFSAWLMGAKDPSGAEAFLADLAALRTDGPGDPRHTLLRRLQAVKNDPRQKVSNVEQAYYFIRAWNAFKAPEKLSQIKASTGAGPLPFPEAS